MVGTQVVGKAFVEAYRQAAANSARQSTAQAGKTAVQNNITRQTGITVEEAHQILNVKKGETDLEAIQKVGDRRRGAFQADTWPEIPGHYGSQRPAKGRRFVLSAVESIPCVRTD